MTVVGMASIFTEYGPTARRVDIKKMEDGTHQVHVYAGNGELVTSLVFQYAYWKEFVRRVDEVEGFPYPPCKHRPNTAHVRLVYCEACVNEGSV